MKTMKLLLIVFAFLSNISAIAQTNVTTVRDEYFIKSDDYKKKLIGKVFDVYDLISNDTTSFVKIQIKDEFKVGNNGYIFLSNQNEVNSFIKDLNISLSKLTNNEVYESAIGKYKTEVKVVKNKKNDVYYAIILNETLGGKAYVSLNESEASSFLEWLKNIKL
jgi:hypothetical protein